jgi:hypothetical protein
MRVRTLGCQSALGFRSSYTKNKSLRWSAQRKGLVRQALVREGVYDGMYS